MRVILPAAAALLIASGCQCAFTAVNANSHRRPCLSLDKEYVLKPTGNGIDYGYAACPLNKRLLHIEHSRFASCRVQDRDTGAVFLLEIDERGCYKLSYLEGGSFSFPTIEFMVRE